MLINLGFPQRPACGDNMGGSGNSSYLKLNVKCSKSKQISPLKFEGIFYVNFCVVFKFSFSKPIPENFLLWCRFSRLFPLQPVGKIQQKTSIVMKPLQSSIFLDGAKSASFPDHPLSSRLVPRRGLDPRVEADPVSDSEPRRRVLVVKSCVSFAPCTRGNCRNQPLLP